MSSVKEMKTFSSYLEEKLREPEWAAGFVQAKTELAVGIAIARAREARHLTQRELATKTGIKQPQLARIERGQAPNITTIAKIAAALDAAFTINPDGQTMFTMRSA